MIFHSYVSLPEGKWYLVMFYDVLRGIMLLGPHVLDILGMLDLLKTCFKKPRVGWEIKVKGFQCAAVTQSNGASNGFFPRETEGGPQIFDDHVLMILGCDP